MKKKILNVILSISLLFTMISINSIDVFADGHSHDGISDWIGVSSLPSTSGNYYLTDDITLSDTWNVSSGETNLCLNGHIINADSGNFRVITIPSGATLNLYDCNGSSSSHEGYVDSNSLWNLGSGGGTSKTITGGIITGGLRGGLIVSGTFNMYGGSIAGNDACISGDHGGGIFVNQNAEANIINGTIENNNCYASGGGIHTDGTFTMSGGIIQDNKAKNSDGGGVSINGTKGEAKLTGTAMIINNVANLKGGGVSYYGASDKLTLGQKVQIVNNLVSNGSVINNVFGYDGHKFKLGTGTDVPATGMKVGVTTSSSPNSNPVQFTSNGNVDDVNYFFSDDTTFGVNFNADHLELFKPLDNVHNITKDLWYSTLAEAIADATSGDVIKLWQNSNPEDAILPDGVTLYVKSNYTGNISVISGKVRVTQDATGDFRYKYSVANAPVEDNPSSNSNHIVLNTGVGNVSTNN